MLKIGTWNVNAAWSLAHEAILTEANCDVWLLTELPPAASLPGYHQHFSEARMTRGQHYAAIFSRLPLAPLKDPHAATAAAVVDGVTYWSSILPWASCGLDPSSPWHGMKTVAGMVHDTLDQLQRSQPSIDLVWGGDWNQNLIGGWQHVGSSGGLSYIEDALKCLGLQVPTASLPHRIEGSHTIDQIAVSKKWAYCNPSRIRTEQLSDHDAYTIEVATGHS